MCILDFQRELWIVAFAFHGHKFFLCVCAYLMYVEMRVETLVIRLAEVFYGEKRVGDHLYRLHYQVDTHLIPEC